MVTKLKQYANKTIQLCTFMLLIVVSYMCIYSIAASIDYDRRREYYFAIFIAVLVCLLLMIFIKRLIEIRVYDKRSSFVILFVFVFIIQIVLFIIITPLPIWDSMSVIEEALRMVEDGFNMSSQNGYFERYGNNYPFTIFLAVLYKMLDILNIGNYWLVSVVLNTILIDASYVIGTYLIYKRSVK